MALIVSEGSNLCLEEGSFIIALWFVFTRPDPVLEFCFRAHEIVQDLGTLMELTPGI